MQLRVNSDVAYLIMPGSKSCIAGYFYCAADPNPLSYNKLSHNAPILVECWTNKNVVCSAAEAKCSGLFHNAQNAIMIQNILQVLDHPQ
eukprot:4487043-Ditylum_brightwellii.AAC.1